MLRPITPWQDSRFKPGLLRTFGQVRGTNDHHTRWLLPGRRSKGAQQELLRVGRLNRCLPEVTLVPERNNAAFAQRRGGNDRLNLARGLPDDDRLRRPGHTEGSGNAGRSNFRDAFKELVDRICGSAATVRTTQRSSKAAEGRIRDVIVGRRYWNPSEGSDRLPFTSYSQRQSCPRSWNARPCPWHGPSVSRPPAGDLGRTPWAVRGRSSERRRGRTRSTCL